jgi:hypothetical protein
MTLPKVAGIRGTISDPKVLDLLAKLSIALNPSGDPHGIKLLAVFLSQDLEHGTLLNIAMNPNVTNPKNVLLALKQTCEDNLKAAN